MKSILLAAVCIAVAGPAAAQAIHQSNGSESATMTDMTPMTGEAAAISSLEARWTAALIAKDQATLETLLAPEFQLVGIRSTGATAIHRAEWLATAGSIVFQDFKTQTTSVQLFGDTALATVEGRWDIVFRGHPIKENFYITDVWVRRDGAWRVVRRHSSPYQATVAPPVAQSAVTPAPVPDEVFRTVVRLWETGDLGRFDDLVARDYVGHVSSGDRDREGLRRRILAFRQSYTSVRF